MAKCKFESYPVPMYPGQAFGASKACTMCQTHFLEVDPRTMPGGRCLMGAIEDLQERMTRVERDVIDLLGLRS